MPDLFGLDIAGIVNDAIDGAGGLRPGTLTRKTAGTRTPGSLTGGTNPGTAAYSLSGFVETEAERRANSAVATRGATMTIMGASVSIAPAVNDTVLMDGSTYTLVELLERDPAAATYMFAVEER